MKIAILNDYQDVVRSLHCFGRLAGHEVRIWTDHTHDYDVLAERLKDVEVLVPIRERTPIRAALIERLPKLKLISQKGAILPDALAACTRQGVVVSSDTQSAQSVHATAELNWGLILCAMRRIPQEAAALKAGQWQSGGLGLALHGRTLGIYGYGKIGATVAGYGKAFGMQVLVWGREGSLQRAREAGYATADSREQLFEQSDVLSIQVKLNEDTRHGVTASDFARMKPTSVFVNTGRAALVAPGTLEAALKAGRPGSAAVDVFEEEPVLNGAHPLLAMGNAICTPHLGYYERDVYEMRFAGIFDQILAYASGRPIGVMNPEVLAPKSN